MYVKELDILLTVKILKNTRALLSLGKLCDENGLSFVETTGFDYFCNKKHDSDYRETGATRYHGQESKFQGKTIALHNIDCSLKRPIFASKIFVVCVRRQ